MPKLTPFNVKTLTVIETDTVIGKTARQDYKVNLSSFIGADHAFAGFTGACGALTSVQNIIAWTWDKTPESAPSLGDKSLSMGGRGSLREDAFINFLRAHLPQKYKVGRGEVFTSENQSSGQLDVILYDEQNCPSFLQAESHGAFPIEAVYGVISVKSDLTSGELKDAYLNIASPKRITPKNPVWHPSNQGVRTAANSPTPVTGVFAYRASRSLEAVQKQVQTLDQELDDISLRPDFVAIAEMGFVGLAIPLRGSLNNFHLPMAEDLGSLHKSGRSTIFVLMMNFYRELRTIILNPFDFLEYRNMPKLVGKHRVEHADIVSDGTRIIL